MRTLNKRQKDYLDKLFHQHGIQGVDDMSKEEQDTLVKMNDHETVWQNADRHLFDMALKKMYDL